jgi:hypothetical protein
VLRSPSRAWWSASKQLLLLPPFRDALLALLVQLLHSITCQLYAGTVRPEVDGQLGQAANPRAKHRPLQVATATGTLGPGLQCRVSLCSPGGQQEC